MTDSDFFHMYIYYNTHTHYYSISFGFIFDFMSDDVWFSFIGLISFSRFSSSLTLCSHVRFFFSIRLVPSVCVEGFLEDLSWTIQHFSTLFRSFVLRHFASLTQVSNSLKSKHTFVCGQRLCSKYVKLFKTGKNDKSD